MEKSPKISDKYNCDVCHYKCCKTSEWNKHISTSKHKNRISLEHEISKPIEFACKYCDKKYTARNSLWYHEIKCNTTTKTNNELTLETTIIMQLMKQNQEFKDMIIEQNKTIVDAIKNCSANISNNQVNSNNKTFNLQVFLNEECKDAMDIKDFIDSIQFQLADVESVGELGYINGISKIIIQNLNALDTYKRPVHCTDEKRETIYIKDAGVWTKDDDNNKLRRMIQSVSNRNFKHTRLYREKHPDCNQADSRYSDTYNKIILEATGGGSKCNDTESENKIMKKIAKVIGIDKHNLS